MAGLALASITSGNQVNATLGGTLEATPALTLSTATIGLSLLAITMAYLGGMFLNDVFDANFDAAHRNE